jgi:predicted transcriptional regulator
MTRERDEAGQYVETVGPEDVLDVFDAVDGPAITSSDVAEHLECTTEAARQKLQRLVEDGTLDRRKTGRTVIYWRAERRTHTPDDTPPRASAEESIGDDVDDDTDRLTAALDATDDLRATVRPALAGDGDLLERRVDAILRMYVYLREHGTAESDDLRDVVDPDAVDYAGADSVWSNMVKGKDTLRALPGVRTPSAGKATWRYEDE